MGQICSTERISSFDYVIVYLSYELIDGFSVIVKADCGSVCICQ